MSGEQLEFPWLNLSLGKAGPAPRTPAREKKSAALNRRQRIEAIRRYVGAHGLPASTAKALIESVK